MSSCTIRFLLDFNSVSSDNANGETSPNDTATFEYMKATFTAHYNGDRQPIGIYMHPIHVSVNFFYLSDCFKGS